MTKTSEQKAPRNTCLMGPEDLPATWFLGSIPIGSEFPTAYVLHFVSAGASCAAKFNLEQIEHLAQYLSAKARVDRLSRLQSSSATEPEV